MTKQPRRRRGRVPAREKRVYLLVDGEFDGQPTIDLLFYLNRMLDSCIPVVSQHEEVVRVLDAHEDEFDTLLLRFRNLSPVAMRRMLQTAIADYLPRNVHPVYYR